MDILRRAFRDIAAGQTRGTVLGRTAYVRHLSYAHQIEFDQKRDEFYEDARKMGIKTDAERLEALAKSGEWSSAKEQDLVRSRQNVSALVEGKRKATMPSMIAGYTAKIAEAEKEYNGKATEKRKLMGLTCEVQAEREVNDFYIVTNVFSDPGLTRPLFSMDEEFDYFRDNGVQDMMDDLTAYVKAHPTRALVGAAVIGFFAGRMARRS